MRYGSSFLVDMFKSHSKVLYIHLHTVHTYFRKERGDGKLIKVGNVSIMGSNWFSWANVRAHSDMGQADTSGVGLCTVFWLSDEVDCSPLSRSFVVLNSF